MESVFVRNAKTGALLANAPVAFVRVPEVGEYVQWGNSSLSVSAVMHGWNAQKQPVCELRVLPSGPGEGSMSEGMPSEGVA